MASKSVNILSGLELVSAIPKNRISDNFPRILKLMTVLVALRGRWPRLYKIGIYFVIFYFKIRGKLSVIRCHMGRCSLKFLLSF